MSKKVNNKDVPPIRKPKRMSLPNEPGIYKITVNDRSYYGRSNDIRKRVSRHLRMLRNGKHHNLILQRSYDKNLDFDAEVLELISSDAKLKEREQHYIDNTNNCNLAGSANGGNGLYGNYNPAFDKTVYGFYNYSKGLIVFTTQHNFKEEFGVEGRNLSRVLSGRKPSCQGWTLIKDSTLTAPKESIIHRFVEKDTGEVFKGTASEFYKDKGLDSSGTFKLIYGKYKSLNNWRYDGQE